MSRYNVRSRACGACALGLSLGLGCADSQSVQPQIPVEQRAEPSVEVTAFAVRKPQQVMFMRPRILSSLPGYEQWLVQHQEALDRLESVQTACQLDPFQHVDEVLISNGEQGAVIALQLNVPAERALQCALKIGGKDAKRDRLLGRPAVRLDSEVLTVLGSVVLIGSEDNLVAVVENAEDQAGAAPRWLPDLRHTANLVMLGVGGTAGLRTVSNELLRQDDGQLEMRIRYDAVTAEAADAITEALAEALPREMAAALATLSPAERAPIAARWQEATVRRRVGQRCELRMPMVLPADGDAPFEPLAAGLMQALLRDQATRQARARLIDLAVRIKQHAEAHPANGAPRLPGPAPRTPSQLARGLELHEARVANWEHPTWQTLAFSSSSEDLFSYEIETKPQRRAALLRAVSDLDGDGRPATLELEVWVSTAGAVLIGNVNARGDRE